MTIWQGYVIFTTIGALIDIILKFVFVYQNAVLELNATPEQKLLFMKICQILTIVIGWPILIFVAILSFFRFVLRDR